MGLFDKFSRRSGGWDTPMRQPPIPTGSDGACPAAPPEAIEPMTRDELNRELRAHSATFPAVLIVYAVILGTMILTGMSMV